MDQESFAGRARELDATQYRAFLTAVETGKWPDGQAVTANQAELMMQAIIIYEHEHVPVALRSGFVPDGCGTKGNKDAGSAVARGEGSEQTLIASTGSSGEAAQERPVPGNSGQDQ